jgi:hypothetical protein
MSIFSVEFNFLLEQINMFTDQQKIIATKGFSLIRVNINNFSVLAKISQIENLSIYEDFKFLKYTDHHYLPRLIGYIPDYLNQHWLCFEDKTVLSLKQFLENRSLDLYRRLRLCLKITEIFVYFSSKDQVLCPSPESFMVDEFENPMLIEFSSTKKLRYLPPEVLISNDICLQSVPWALSCLLFFILLKCKPFNNYKKITDYNKTTFALELIIQDLRPEVPESYFEGLIDDDERRISDDFFTLLSRMWLTEPDERVSIPTAYGILKGILAEVAQIIALKSEKK